MVRADSGDTPDSGGTPGGRWFRGRRAAAVAGALVLVGGVAAAVSLTSGGDGSADTSAPGETRIEVSLAGCGKGWDDPHPGAQDFGLRNTADRTAEVYLVDSSTGAVYGEVEGLAPGTTRTLRATLGDGSYRFRCLPDDAAAINGPVVHIKGGHGASGPAALPVTQHDLIPPTLGYQKWVGGQMSDLVKKVDALRDAVRSGDLGAARDAWLPAHLQYERLGAAYGTFGDADGAINGTDAGLPKGVDDPGFTGFHRIERGLWHGESAAALRPYADQLSKDAKGLRDDWSGQRMDPLDLGLRAHEILENTVQFELNGRTDFGSGSNLATARANLDGTEAVMTRLRPLLKSRMPHLKDLDTAMDRARSTLDAQRDHGHWTPLDKLSAARRARVNADLGDLVERLADVAAICDTRRTA
ncbi:EfeM/EfeO family lipoprotein [Streptomyces sp. NPDC050560]|uniref:EfeM/EfeO family lipoprotein n=1 Tax=Streptomyces sp. NPDC050560 TaxID=3365630 RepID=UPI00378AD066